MLFELAEEYLEKYVDELGSEYREVDVGSGTKETDDELGSEYREVDVVSDTKEIIALLQGMES